MKWIFLATLIRTGQSEPDPEITEKVESFLTSDQSGHTNNWAVLVCASRYWFNYRHVANTLAVYRSVKKLGIPDSQVLLFLADDMACNGRNGAPGAVYHHRNKILDLYGRDVEVDFRGEEVTVQNLIRLLTGRQDKDTPRSRRLNTDSKSNILFYLTGHGGENFLKFQDDEEINAFELADAFEQMNQKKRYNELLFIVDTCQAQSIIRSAYSEGFVGFASSRVGEDSLSHHVDPELGVYMVDRYTYHLLEFMESVSPNSAKKLSEIKKVCPTQQCISTPVNRFDLLKPERRSSAKVTDFFGSERKMIPLTTKATAKVTMKETREDKVPSQVVKSLSVAEIIALEGAIYSNQIDDGQKDLKLLVSLVFLIPICATMIYSLIDT